MKPRWLLLGLSLLCLLLLFPVAALSQGYSVDAGCGTATIDGYVGAAEWAGAGTVPLYKGAAIDGASPADVRFEGVAPSQVEIGQALFMNDGRYLYLGAILNDADEEVLDNPAYFDTDFVFAFEDEPAGDPEAWKDCTWQATSCAAPEDEGALSGSLRSEAGPAQFEEKLSFDHFAAPHTNCQDEAPFTGLTYVGLPQGGGAHMEMRVDLDTSPLNNPDPAAGDCFDLRWLEAWFTGPDPAGGTQYLRACWPSEPVDYDPYTGECTILCLDPCQVEFVPEPGTILLLGGGLMGLAGYATLRWRSRR